MPQSSDTTKKKRKDTVKVPQKYLRENELLELTIASLEEEQEATAAAMEANASDVDELGKLYEKNEQLEQELSAAYERWEELSVIINGN